ncbi:hypothetical protein FH972_005550 [Carpinus fangiana]|uniref:WRKY domain-containing protein n=1 Tax=Carpinus fangiana TaxID=176857 RepID=A0A5N6QQK3_9ROSI|nr:hypothetical protein FH972_005550 [Carpinus fangiana]
MFYQLSVLQMEMNRMKEENRVLRKVVEQTMKDYHDLQMKLSTIHQNNQEKDPQIFLSLRGNDEASREPKTAPEILGINNQRALSPTPSQHKDGIRESELGLSLRIHTDIEEHEQKEGKEGEYKASFTSLQNKLQRSFSWMHGKQTYHNNNNSNPLTSNLLPSPREVGDEENNNKTLAENVTAMASDPKFRVAVAAAITSLINKESHTSHPVGTATFGPRDGGETGSSTTNNWILESLPGNGKPIRHSP